MPILTLSRREVEFLPGSDRLREVRNPSLLGTPHRANGPQGRLFGLGEVLGDGWVTRPSSSRSTRPGDLAGLCSARS